MPGTVNPTQSLDWHQTLCEFDFRTNQTQCNKVHWTQSIRLCSIGLGIQTQLNPIQWIAFDCFWGVNSLEQRLCGLKNKKNEMYWSNSNLKKLAIDFPPHFYKKQEFRNQNFDLVRLSNYFYTSSIWFDGQTQPIDWVWFSWIEILLDWVQLTMLGKWEIPDVFYPGHSPILHGLSCGQHLYVHVCGIQNFVASFKNIF